MPYIYHILLTIVPPSSSHPDHHPGLAPDFPVPRVVEHGEVEASVERVPGVPREDDAVADVPGDPELRAPLGELKVLRARLLVGRVVWPGRPAVTFA